MSYIFINQPNILHWFSPDFDCCRTFLTLQIRDIDFSKTVLTLQMRYIDYRKTLLTLQMRDIDCSKTVLTLHTGGGWEEPPLAVAGLAQDGGGAHRAPSLPLRLAESEEKVFSETANTGLWTRPSSWRCWESPTARSLTSPSCTSWSWRPPGPWQECGGGTDSSWPAWSPQA